MTRTHRRDLWAKIIKLESEVERLVELLEQSDANDKLTIAAFFGGGTGPFCSVPEMMAATARDQITELEAEVGRLHTWDGLMSLLDEHYPADVPLVSDPANGPGPRLVATIREVDQLREALRPFADVAKGIPDNWPGECRLRVDHNPVQEWLSYYEAGTPNATFPTIAEWRAVLATQQPEGEGGK